MPIGAGAVLLAVVVASAAPAGADEAARAAELLAQPDAAARDRWIEAHRDTLTPGLGRELAAAARVHYLAGRYPPATDGYALALRVGELTGDHESRLRALEGLGNVERFQGRPTEAMVWLERALKEAEGASDTAGTGRVLGSLGSARRMRGEYTASLALFERALALFEGLRDAEWIGRTHFNIGTTLGALGRCQEALPHLERSRASAEAGGAAAAAAAANAYNNIAVCQQQLGNFAAALEALGHCLQIAESSGNRSELAAPLNNIGNVYRAQGAPLRALDSYRRSYAISSEQGETHFMSEALDNEGGLLMEMGRLPEARKSLDRALALARETHRLPDVAVTSADLAELHARLGQRARALELLQQALEAAETMGDVPLQARARRAIAALRLEEGQAAAALEQAERATSLARRSEVPEELWPALMVAGRARRTLGQPEAAEKALREAVAVVEELRAHAVGPESDRAAFLVPRVAPYQELVALLADAGRPWDALAVAERSKARVLLDVLAGGRAAIGSALTPEERAEEVRLEADVRGSNSELRALLTQPQPDAARQRALEEERTARRLALENWRTRQYAEHAELRVLRGESLPLGREDAARLLRGGLVLLEYSLAGRHAYVFALRAGAGGEPVLAVHRLGAAADDVVRRARDLRQRLAARDLAFGPAARRLHQVLLGPVAGVLRGARHVVIVPDGPLWELPFQALRSRAGRYLVEDAALSYAPSLSVLRDMRAHRRGAPAGGPTLLAVGNPDLGRGARRRDPAALMSDLQPLPEAEAEVRAIARLYGPGAAEVRVGAEAREAWVKQAAPRFRVLHLATHGLLDDASPLYSQLVLAAPRAGEEDDGLLEAREILDLGLDADLAVLSACETGRGRSGAGEGLIGMAWAFFVAGCPATVASQWKVEAAGTNRLMQAFHRGLRAGQGPAEALRRAALARLHQAGGRHPFYWAGFVAMGDALPR